MNKVGGHMLPDFKSYYKATVMTQHGIAKEWHTDQWDRTESPEIQPHKCSQLTFNKGHSIEKWYFQQIVLEQFHLHTQENKPRHRPHTFHKR